MRSLALLVTAVAISAGCLEFGDSVGNGQGNVNADQDVCPESVDPPASEGRAVEVQVANNMESPTCARVYFDGSLVAAGELQGEHPALHNNPVSLAAFEWNTADVLVRVEDSLTGRSYEEAVTLEPDATWVAIWIGEGGFAIRTFDEKPAYM